MGSGLQQQLAPGVHVIVRRLCFCPDVVERRRSAARACPHGIGDGDLNNLSHEGVRGVIVERWLDHGKWIEPRWIVSLDEPPICSSNYELEWSWERQAQTGRTGHNEVRAYERDILVLDAVTLLGELA